MAQQLGHRQDTKPGLTVIPQKGFRTHDHIVNPKIVDWEKKKHLFLVVVRLSPSTHL